MAGFDFNLRQWLSWRPHDACALNSSAGGVGALL